VNPFRDRGNLCHRIGADGELLHVKGDALPGEQNGAGNSSHEGQLGGAAEDDARAGGFAFRSEGFADPGGGAGGVNIRRKEACARKARVDMLQRHALVPLV
jgi:hypothetical protein